MYPFHLAIRVRDLAEADRFYGNVLGLARGRSGDLWQDYDCYGHQLVVHLNTSLGAEGQVKAWCNPVDGHAVPVPHFGVVLDMPAWLELRDRLQGQVHWLVEPHVRFAGHPGEQATLFFADPSGNALEFKGFRDPGRQLFSR